MSGCGPGRVPLPLSQVIDRVSAKARELRVDLRWAQQDGDPVALIRLPTQHPEHADRQVILESIQLGSGEVVLTGRTE